MDLIQKLKDIKKTSILHALPTDTAKDFDELWDKLIEPTLPPKNAVIKWHELLMAYIKKPDAVFSLRIYGTPPGNSPMLRRGFYNTTDHDFDTFYADNFFTAYFYSMAFDDYIPTLSEFEEAIHGKQFPCGYIQTKDEKSYAAYLKGVDPAIAKKGYKIAHIFSAGKDYNSTTPYRSIEQYCKQLFPRAVNTDWAAIGSDKYGTYHYRKIDVEPSVAKQARDFAVAHFLRTVHPINYFLVPKKSTKDKITGTKRTNIFWYDDGIERDEIGENPQLIEYVAAKIKAEYGAVYDEFLSYIYPNANLDPVAKNKTIDAIYGLNIWMTKSSTTTPAPASTKRATPAKAKTGKSGIGEHAREVFTKLLSSGQLSPSLIRKLTDKAYCKATFNVNYPVLTDASCPYDRRRYYSTPIGSYAITNDWYERNKNPLDDWIANNGFTV